MSEKTTNERIEVVEPEFEGLTEKEVKEFKPLLVKFLKSYSKKGENVSDKEWLEGIFKQEIPNLSQEEAVKMAEETVDSIKDYDNNLSDLNTACKQGVTKENWFADKVAEAGIGLSVVKQGEYLTSVDNAINAANTQMQRVIITKNQGINLNPNLDGFIAEQQHVNSFNAQAALNKSDFVAEVVAPNPGETYGKNSFDAVIKNKNTGKIVHQFQFKYGSDAKATIQLIKSGNYNNQRIIVPPEQLAEVQAAFPGKTIESCIGGTEKVAIKSKPLTKQQVKEMQLDAQTNEVLPTTSWNDFDNKKIAINIGKSAGVAGIQAAAFATGFTLVEKIVKGEQIDSEETVETALKTGADAGVKAAAAGALTVAVKKDIIRIIPKGTLPGTIANIACVAIENIKILGKVAKGEYTMSEGLEHMGRTSTAMVYGLSCAAKGAAIGASVLSWIPVVGPAIGGVVGGIVGYTAGSKFGQAVFNGIKKVGNAIKSGAVRVGSAVRGFARRVLHI